MSESGLRTTKAHNSKGVDAILRGSSQPVSKKQRNHQYSLQNKQTMLREYESTPNFRGKLKQFNAKYKVSPGFITKAQKTLSKLEAIKVDRNMLVRMNGPEMEVNSKRKTISFGRKVTYPEEEDWLYLQFQLYEAHEISMTTSLLIALLVAKFPHLSVLSDDKLKGWMYRWQARYKVTARRVTHSHQADEQEIGETLVDFMEYYRALIADFNISPMLVVNMDETACDLSEALTTTLASRGKKAISIQLPSNLPSRVTVLLAVSFEGIFLPPLIVFKGKPKGRVVKEFSNDTLNYPRDCFYSVQENAWCDQQVMDKWIQEVYNPFVEGKKQSQYDNSLLIMDNFSVHCTLETSQGLAESSSRLLLLPPNTTSKTQVMDVGLNRSFKRGIRDRFQKFMAAEFKRSLDDMAANQIEDHLASVDFNKITRPILANWISEVWNDCRGTIQVENTLRHIGYTS